MNRIGILAEIWRFILWMSFGAFVGWSTGHLLVALLAFSFAYIAFTFWQLAQFERWVSQARRKRFRSNGLTGIYGELIEDIISLTKRYKKDRKRLQQVVERVQQMTSALTDSVILLDTEDNIEWWNPQAQRQFGFRNIDVGHKLVNILRFPNVSEYFEKQDFSQDSLLFSLPRSPDKKLELRVQAFGKGDKLVVIRDMTRMERLENIRSDFVANVSHELRTPLTIIGGYVETLADEESITPARKKAMSHIERQVKRMTLLINDLLSLSNLETEDASDDTEWVKAAPLIERAVDNAQTVFAEREHTYKIKVQDAFSVLGVENELYSAISNLIFNAARYTPERGEITVLIKLTNLDAQIAVIDNGVGIDPKHLSRLTERFYRVDKGRKSDEGGTGLGLAIVKHVLLRHDGKLTISSKFGQGSTFSCHFPKERIRAKSAAPNQ